MTISECADPWPSHPWHPGPLASHITWFAERLAEQGYAPFTTHEKLRLVMHLSQWLQEQHVGADALDEPCIGQFLQYRQQQGRAPRHHGPNLAKGDFLAKCVRSGAQSGGESSVVLA